MELRCCTHLHFIQAIKGGLVTKVANVARGQPKLTLKKVSDIYDGLLSHNDDGMVERSCGIEETTVKTMSDASVYNFNDGDDQRINNLDDDDFDNFTLTQIKEICKTRKRKHSQGLDSPKRNIKIEDSSFLEDYRKEQMEADDSDFMETLSSWKSKLPKNMKAKKKRCFKDPIPTFTQEIMLVVKSEEILNSQEFPLSSEEIQDGQEFPPSSEEIQDGQEFPPSSEGIEINQEISSSIGDSAALVEVKSEVPETDCFGRPDDYSIIEGQEAEIIYGWNLENELNYDWQENVDLIPLRMVRPSRMDIVISDSQNIPAIEFESEECIIHPDLHYISPEVISLVEDHNSDIYDNQPDGDTATTVSLPNVATHKDLDCIGVEFKDDNTFLGDCSNDEYTTSAEDQVKPNSSIEHGPNPDGCLVCRSDDPPEFKDDNTFVGDCCIDEFTTGDEEQVKSSSTIEHSPNPDGCLGRHSDDSPEYGEKQSFASVNIDEKRNVNESTDELTSWEECNGSSKLHCPERLLSTRKAISPSSQERLCKAVESVDLSHKNNLKSKGKLYFSEPTDKTNGTAEGLDDITGTRFTDIPNKIRVIPRTSKRVSHPKGISKPPHSSRQAPRLGCNSVQSCSKSAIAFTQQQMHDAECIAMKLTKELKSMKDIVDDMLRSEFCLNTSLRHKVNEARMAVKNATRAEESSKRCLAFMSRDCSRFCKIMKLADDGPPPQEEVVRKERKKIAFADEAGGRLCQVKFYEDDGASLSESN